MNGLLSQLVEYTYAGVVPITALALFTWWLVVVAMTARNRPVGSRQR